MVTVFTPTYNRGYIIEKLYDSLKRQISKNFEWIVIDDGSTDNTEELFQTWVKEENEFTIRYRKVPNGGKHRAINTAVKMAHGEAFFFADSDDYLTEDAVEFVEKHFPQIENNPEFAGISGLRTYHNLEPVGGEPDFAGEYVDATNLERTKYRLNGDKAEIYKTSVLKRYPFPAFEHENFLTEGVVLNKIAKDGYKIRWFKKIIYICEYLEDGLTKSGFKKQLENPQGHLAFIQVQEEIYGKELGKKLRFRFYLLMERWVGTERAAEIMHLNKSQEADLKRMETKMWAEINHIFHENQIHKMAIYGLGQIGNEFLFLADSVNAGISYAIDQKVQKHEQIKVCKLTDELEPVDAVLITLKNKSAGLEQTLREKFHTVMYWRDLTEKYWSWD